MSGVSADLWFTRQQAADLVGLSARQFDDAIRPRLPEKSERKAGKTLQIYGPAIVAALVEYRVEQVRPQPTDDDPLLVSGGGSPNLERYRLAKAIEAEKNNAERDGVLVSRQVFIDALRPAVMAMRQAGDTLVKQFGNGAGDIFCEAVEDFESAAEQVIHQFSSDDAKPDLPRARRDDATEAAANAD